MSHSKLQLKGFVVWGVCALFFLYEFFLRTVTGAYQEAIMHDLKLISFQFSLLSTTVFLLVYSVMQIPAGLLIDHIGLKKSLMIGAFFCSIASFGFSFSDTYATALGYRFLMGFGASFGFVCLLVSVYDWMPHRYIAIFIGLSQFIGTLGPMIATGPLETLTDSYALEWRQIFLSLGVLGAVLWLLIFVFVENNRKKSGRLTILYKPERILDSILKLFSRSQPFWIAAVSACLYFSVEYFSENEGRSFLELKGVSSVDAGYMLTLSWVGYAIGCPLLGALSDFLERRKSILNGCAWLSLISIFFVLYAQEKIYLQLAFLLLGISASGQSIGFALISEQFKKNFVSIGFGFNNMFITTISALNATATGALLDHVRCGELISMEHYLSVFNGFLVVAFLAILISAFFIKETYCKSKVDFTILESKKNGAIF